MTSKKINQKTKRVVTTSQNLLVLTGFSCNNNCLMCSIKTKEKDYPDRSFDDIAQDLETKRKAGYANVEFTGGETTIRKDIVELVALAKDLGYQTIGMSTNGRLFSYQPFCDKIIKAGLNRVTFSLLGPAAVIHNGLTRTPDSFEQILAGIKNVQKHKGVHINISSVISRLNYRDLLKFGRFILSLGVKEWYLLDLIPDGSAGLNYKNLVVRLEDLSEELNSLMKISAKFQEIGFFDFPACLFDEAMRSLANACFVNAKKRDEISKQVGYNPERITLKDGSYSDVYRLNIGICGRCEYGKECGGVWKEYLKLYGEEEINKLAKSHASYANDKKN